MNVVKVSIFFMDITFIFNYKKREGCTFWESLKKKLKAEFSDISVENEGSAQAVLYAPSAMEPDEVKKVVSRMVGELTAGESDNYIISVSAVSDAVIARLTASNPGEINDRPWFQSFLGSDGSGSAAISPQKPVDDENPASRKSSHAQEASAQQPPAPEKPLESPAAAEPPAPKHEENTTIAAEISSILKQKEILLNKVRGQRHAVDEFINALFECDAFTKQNPNRKGPLASFLFTGPSGVGKTLLAQQCEALLGRKCKIIDMSEFSNNLSYGRLNGEMGGPGILTSFIRQNPNGIVVFDEMEKSHINTIHLLLQILDEGHLTDAKINKEISFKDAVIIITTNAGSSLYDDSSVYDLSKIPRKVILEALRKDVNPQTNEPYFPDCIVTRFANGHVVLFNHLEPYALTEIIRDEIALQAELFKKSYGITLNYDPDVMAALVLFNGGGASDARSLRGIARQMIVKEVQECITQIYKKSGESVNSIERIDLCVDIDADDKDVSSLFINNDKYTVLVFADDEVNKKLSGVEIENTVFVCTSSVEEFKKSARGVIDYVLIDPLAGLRDMDRVPHDVEDVLSDGMDMFEYFTSYYSELPVYVIDSKGRDFTDFDTLINRGVRGVVKLESTEEFSSSIQEISFHSHINNAVFSLGRSGKVLNYNCSQFSADEKTAVILFTRLNIGFAKSSDDSNVITDRDRENGVTFKDIIGCKAAKEALGEFCEFVKNPRAYYAQGKHVPNGVLLYGPPGTGKTMLAKAMANETDVAFIPATATSFLAPHVGESEQNVRDLFSRARKYAPSIVFIDEVDAVARKRTGGETTVHYENVLNELIAQMEGFSTDEKRPVFFIAATNYDISGSDDKVLDPAFVRRFDKKIFIDLPDTQAREEFFTKLLARHSVDFGEGHGSVVKTAAQRTVGLNNSDLTKIINMFLSAVSDSEPTGAVLLDMIDSFRYGEINKMSDENMRRTAFHESGHAMVNRLLGSTPAYLTIVARGDFGGYMAHQISDDVTFYTFKKLMDLVCCSLAGRVAEIEIFGEEEGLNTGASSDIEKARAYIKAALDDFAMGENLYSKNEDSAAEKLMKEQYERTVSLVHENRSVLEKLAELLIKRKSLDQHDLEKFFESENC